MKLLVASLVFSVTIIILSKRAQKTMSQDLFENKELEKFYTLPEDKPEQLKQLVLAAVENLKSIEILGSEIQSLGQMFDERLIGESFYKTYTQREQNLIIERTIIGSEAEAIKEGAESAVFSEAKRLLKMQSLPKPEKLFDEASFLRRQSILFKNLKEKIQSE